MDKKEAHAILDKIRDGMSLANATEALEWTGDIQRTPSQSLCVDGNEQRNDRPCALHDTPIGERVGWSRYLDCKTN